MFEIKFKTLDQRVLKYFFKNIKSDQNVVLIRFDQI